MEQLTKAELIEENERLTKKLARLQRNMYGVKERLEFCQGVNAGRRANRPSICGKTCKTCSFFWRQDNRNHCIKHNIHPGKKTNRACGDYIPLEC